MWFFFTAFFVMFVIVLLGVISFSQGFTLGFPGYIIFSAYMAGNTFKYFSTLQAPSCFQRFSRFPSRISEGKCLNIIG